MIFRLGYSSADQPTDKGGHKHNPWTIMGLPKYWEERIKFCFHSFENDPFFFSLPALPCQGSPSSNENKMWSVSSLFNFLFHEKLKGCNYGLWFQFVLLFPWLGIFKASLQYLWLWINAPFLESCFLWFSLNNILYRNTNSQLITFSVSFIRNYEGIS